MATYPSQSAMQGNTDTTPASPGWGGDYVSQGRVAMTGGTSKVQLAGTAQAIKGNTQIDKDEAFREEVQELVEELVDYSTLAGRINQEFSTYKTARQPLERNIWVKAFLNNKGVYGSNLNLEGGTSNAFVQVTSPKVRTALAMAMQILFPPGDQAWTLDAPANPAQDTIWITTPMTSPRSQLIWI